MSVIALADILAVTIDVRFLFPLQLLLDCHRRFLYLSFLFTSSFFFSYAIVRAFRKTANGGNIQTDRTRRNMKWTKNEIGIQVASIKCNRGAIIKILVITVCLISARFIFALNWLYLPLINLSVATFPGESCECLVMALLCSDKMSFRIIGLARDDVFFWSWTWHALTPSKISHIFLTNRRVAMWTILMYFKQPLAFPASVGTLLMNKNNHVNVAEIPIPTKLQFLFCLMFSIFLLSHSCFVSYIYLITVHYPADDFDDNNEWR